MLKKDAARFTGRKTDRRGPSPLKLVRRATRSYPDLFRPALTKLEKLDEGSVDDLVKPRTQ